MFVCIQSKRNFRTQVGNRLPFSLITMDNWMPVHGVFTVCPILLCCVGEVAWCGVCACGGCQPAAHSSWTLCEDPCASGGGIRLWSEIVWQRPGLAGRGMFVCNMFVFVSCVCVVKVYIHLWNDWLTLGVFVCSIFAWVHRHTCAWGAWTCLKNE